MRRVAENVFAVGAGTAIGLLAGLLTALRIASGSDTADAAFAVLIVTPFVMVEVAVGAVVALVLLANGRRGGAVVAAALLGLALVGEYAWLTS